MISTSSSSCSATAKGTKGTQQLLNPFKSSKSNEQLTSLLAAGISTPQFNSQDDSVVVKQQQSDEAQRDTEASLQQQVKKPNE